MHVVLGLFFGGFVVAGVLAVIRGLSLRTSENKSLRVLMFLIAVPLFIFGAAGLVTMMTIAGRE